MVVDLLDIRRDRRVVAARHRAELQVFLDRQTDKGAASLRHMGNTEPDDILGCPTADRFSVKTDVASGSYHTAERPQHRRLAGAIRSEQRAHLPRVEIEPDPEQRLLLAVERVQAGDLEHHGAGFHAEAAFTVLWPVPR